MNTGDKIGLGLTLLVSLLGSTLVVKSCIEDLSTPKESIIDQAPIFTERYTHDVAPKTSIQDTSNRIYKYRVTIEDDPSNWETYEIEPNGQGRVKARRVSNGYEYLNGTWEWECEEYLPTLKDQYNYIKRHHKELRKQP